MFGAVEVHGVLGAPAGPGLRWGSVSDHGIDIGKVANVHKADGVELGMVDGQYGFRRACNGESLDLGDGGVAV